MGPHAGRFVDMQPDQCGFHIYLLTIYSRLQASDGWDYLGGDEVAVDEWSDGDLSSVQWLQRSPVTTIHTCRRPLLHP
jgi:hypothetical protein